MIQGRPDARCQNDRGIGVDGVVLPATGLDADAEVGGEVAEHHVERRAIWVDDFVDDVVVLRLPTGNGQRALEAAHSLARNSDELVEQPRGAVRVQLDLGVVGEDELEGSVIREQDDVEGH